MRNVEHARSQTRSAHLLRPGAAPPAAHHLLACEQRATTGRVFRFALEELIVCAVLLNRVLRILLGINLVRDVLLSQGRGRTDLETGKVGASLSAALSDVWQAQERSTP